ncbi:hypothetical protein PUNSTDRAFT_36294, partial [Punctularia strigosozonata HHB-11173 SS5]|uniref:uncharacterized protein n=1 Tax=Punctularia strigosozonata (strain HHB-11173) TaxID=741275 RepID=UPI000441864F
SAFHAVLGGALALYGSLLARDPAVVPASEEADEPRDPTAYWLAALDVFETGDALPPASGGDTSRPAQDWRLAIAWGHTLVSLASHRLSQPSPPSPSSPSGPPSSPRPYSHRTERGLMPQPTFARRGSLSQTSTNELLTLAADQYSRGIMHMPRPKRAARTSYFSPVQLMRIAEGVVGVAERMEERGERRYWARWADGMLSQVR